MSYGFAGFRFPPSREWQMGCVFVAEMAMCFTGDGHLMGGYNAHNYKEYLLWQTTENTVKHLKDYAAGRMPAKRSWSAWRLRACWAIENCPVLVFLEHSDYPCARASGFHLGFLYCKGLCCGQDARRTELVGVALALRAFVWVTDATDLVEWIERSLRITFL